MTTIHEYGANWLVAVQASWCALSERRQAVILGCFSALVFVTVNWHNYMVDFVPLSLLPVSVCREGTVKLDAFRPYYQSLPENQRYTFTEVDGHLYSIKPIFVSFLAVPFFLPPLLTGVPEMGESLKDGVTTPNVDFWIGWGRLVAAVLTGIAVGLCYRTARRWGTPASALSFTLLLTFGTCVWTVVGQTLTYHAGSVLCIAALVYVLDAFPLSPRRAAAAGFFAGAAVVMRLTPLVLLFPLGLYLSIPGRMKDLKAWLAALGGILVLPLANALLNRAVFGHWYKTGYDEEMGKWIGLSEPAIWLQGMLGIVLAPNAGLIPQSPFLILAAIGTWAVWAQRRSEPDGVPHRGLLRAYSLGTVCYAALFALWHDWWGGLTFASRMLAETYPLLLPLILIGWNRVRRFPVALPLVVAAGVLSVLYEVIGVATFDPISDLNPRDWMWHLDRHFYVIYIQQLGWLPFLRAVGWTLLQLTLILAGACYAVGRILATKQHSPA